MAFEAMGCSFEFVFDGRSLAGGSCESQALAEELRELVLDWHWRLSVFETGSLVSRINRAPAGLALPLDEEMFSLCMLCEQLREDTGGVFNIAAGTLMHVHGFRGLNTPTSLPGRSELGALDLDTAITLDHQKRCLIKAHDWIQLDFGAIAKGYVLDLLRSELESFGIENAFLHGGTSSVLALGEDPQRKPWMAAAGANTRVGLRGLALGVSEHGARTAQRDAVQRDAVQRDGAQFGHIMDARTKQPASNTLTRVVCVHASAAVADAYSTACSAAPELAPELSNNSCSLLAFSSSAPPRTPRFPWSRTLQHSNFSMTDPNRREFLAQAGSGVAAMAFVPSLHAFAGFSGSKPLRVGVIGAGRQGRSISGELSKLEGVSVVAMCDVDERRLASGLRRSSLASGFATVSELIASGTIDAVAIATPTHTHREVAVECIEAGLHIYLECPLAHTREDCVAIVEAARASKAVIAGGLQGRSNPVYSLARGFFKSDSVRNLISMRAQNHLKTTWITPSNDAARREALNWKLDPERANGLAGEWGTHQFDVFHWYTGKYPTRVMGSGGNRFYEDERKVHDTIACSLVFKDGATLAYDATLANSYGGKHEVFLGSAAAIKLGWSHGWMFKEADAPTQGWEVYANRQQFHNDEGITLIAGATKLAEQGKLKDGIGLPNPSVYYALEDWVTAIATEGSPACSIDEAARATVVGIAANQAIVSGATVEIDLSGL